MFIQLFSIFVLGLIGGINPGPILASSFTETLHHGFYRGLQVIIKAALAETIVATFILTLFFSVNLPVDIFYFISFVGAGILIRIAINIWKINSLSEKGHLFSFKKLLSMAIFNGPFLIFWTTVCVPQALLLKEVLTGAQFYFVAIFMSGWFISTTSLNFIFSRFKPLLTKGNLLPYIFRILSLILIFFALKLIVSSVTFFLK
jgi:threonine/homoserine/homoserine lactone efflux protein